MATISKTADIDILTHQAVTHPATVKGSVQDVATKLAAKITLFHACVESAQANTNPGRFWVLTSASSSGDEDWEIVYEFDATISTADTEAMTATEPIGETSLAVASTANFVARDKLYIQDTGTLANSEWALCEAITATPSIDLVFGLTNQKDSSDIIWNDADIFTCFLDLTAVGRLRIVFSHEGAAGANCHVKGLMVTGDSIA